MKTLTPDKFKFNKKTKTFHASGKEVTWDIMYKLVNPTTKGSMLFSLVESTGSEWDPNTVWIYKGEGEYYLHLTNEEVTEEHAAMYLKAKTRK